MLLWAFIVMAIAGGMTIYLGLRTRNAMDKRGISLTATKLWPLVALENKSPKDFLYGIFYDASSTQVGMTIKDYHDKEVGTLLFHIGRRTACITMRLGQEEFEIDSLPKFRKTLVLRRVGQESILCTRTQTAFTSYYKLSEGQTIQIDRRAFFKRRFPIKFHNLSVGQIQAIDPAFETGFMMLCSDNIPIAVRSFILAQR